LKKSSALVASLTTFISMVMINMETRNTNAETVIVSSHLLQSELLPSPSIPNAHSAAKPLLSGTDTIPIFISSAALKPVTILSKFPFLRQAYFCSLRIWME
jgi:hypothetical protein